MTASTTRMQTISGGEGDSVAWPPDLHFDIKYPPSVSRGGLTFARPVSLPKWPHPLAGTTLPRIGRLARASALLLMQQHHCIFAVGSRTQKKPSVSLVNLIKILRHFQNHSRRP